MDPIRFKSNLKVTVQDLGWKRFNEKKFNNIEERRYFTRQDDISTVAFWYQILPSNPLNPLPSQEAMLNQ